jgi:3-phenylpropionate/trans-cinnamate dioxygenase ferredoxin subunit
MRWFVSGKRVVVNAEQVVPKGMFVDVGPDDLIEGELRGLEVGERLILLARLNGRITAMDDSCNHAGCLLSGGWINDRKAAVVCPCHEYAFELGTGKNVTIPKLCDDQRAFEVRIENGRVMIRLEEP